MARIVRFVRAARAGSGGTSVLRARRAAGTRAARPLSRSGRPLPERGAVHLWSIDLDGEPDARNLAVFDAAERARLTRLRPGRARDRYVAAHVALRAILAAYLDDAPARVAMTRSPAGKPGTDGVAFNLTHAGGLALVAIAADGAIGVDVEARRPLRDAARIATRFFTEREAAAVARVEGAARDRAFLVLWTRKEAVLKALGTGLRTPLDTFELSDPDDPVACVRWSREPALRPETYRLAHLELGCDYVGALAVDGPLARVERLTYVPASRCLFVRSHETRVTTRLQRSDLR